MDDSSGDHAVYVRGDTQPLIRGQAERVPGQVFQGRLMNRCPRSWRVCSG